MKKTLSILLVACYTLFYAQSDLVGKMEGNIDPTNISRIEAGRTNPTVITLYRIAEALDIKLIDILNIEVSER